MYIHVGIWQYHNTLRITLCFFFPVQRGTGQGGQPGGQAGGQPGGGFQQQQQPSGGYPPAHSVAVMDEQGTHVLHESSVGLSNPSLGVAIPVPAQAHLYTHAKGRATYVPSLEN